MKKKDLLAVITILLLITSSLVGILSMDYTKAYDFVNQYGQTVSIYNYGIYARDSFFQATVSVGTDICILFVLVPMFIFAYVNYCQKGDKVSRLKLISVYAIALYYATSIAFGLVYNRLFLVYAALFSCSLFGMFRQLLNLKWEKAYEATRGVKIFLTLAGVALIVAWLPDIIPTLFTGEPPSLIAVYTTVITYVLDMGIISPLCFVSIVLLKKKHPLGTVLLEILLRTCLVVGIMMIPQTVCQLSAGVELPMAAIITKSFSFVLLGAFAFHFERKLMRAVGNEPAL